MLKLGARLATDPRFPAVPLTVGQLAEQAGVHVHNGDQNSLVLHVGQPEKAQSGQLIYISDKSAFEGLDTKTGYILLTSAQLLQAHEDKISGAAAILLDDKPRLAFAKMARLLYPDLTPTPSIHPTAVIDDSAEIGEGVAIGPYVVIGPGVRLGNDVQIAPHVQLQYCDIGAASVIGGHSAIGQAGFGFEMTAEGAVMIPHIGRVHIGAHCHISQHCNIDRGVLDDTRLGDMVMIDSLVHIAHNVEIGDRTIILAQTGIAGSVRVGSDCIIGAQVGMADHIEIADNTVLLSRTGATQSLGPGQFAGFPAEPARGYWRAQAVLKRLVADKQKKRHSD